MAYMNVICSYCGAAMTINTDQPVHCANCGGEVCNAEGMLTGAYPAPPPQNMQYAQPPPAPYAQQGQFAQQMPPPAQQVQQVQPMPQMQTPFPGQMQQMPYAAASPEQIKKYHRQMKFWGTGVVVWFLVQLLVFAVTMENKVAVGLGFMLLLGGASALGATLPVHPEKQNSALLRKFVAFLGILLGLGMIALFGSAFLAGMLEGLLGW